MVGLMAERIQTNEEQLKYEEKILDQDLGESEIQKFFADSTVFLTGGTGFLGKLLIEKLLRSCPDIKKIYFLARPKKNKDITQRLKEQFNDVVYNKLREQYPDFIKKLDVIEGDMGEIGLGMKEEDRKKIINETEIIFHGAATVNLDELLKRAVEINVRGSKEIIQLARSCSKLKAMVHISTVYSNCMITEVDEKFYGTPLSGDNLITLMDTLDEKTFNNITSELLGDCPNTYTYTKAAAENIVQEYGKGLPVALFRPSIVIGTAEEPIPGWIDNIYGPTGVVVGAAVGVLHVLECNPKAIADLVPGDMVVNACIAAAWKSAKDYFRNRRDGSSCDIEPTVYNYVSSQRNPITWEKFMGYVEMHGQQVPTLQAVWYYLLYLIPSKFTYKTYCLFLHWIPAYVVDAICILIRKKPVLKKLYTKIDKFSKVIAYFAVREWKFYDDNVACLYKELCKADKHLFNFDISTIEWRDYYYTYTRGVRQYLIKDPIETVPEAIKKKFKLKCLHYGLIVTVILLLSWLIRFFFSLILG